MQTVHTKFQHPGARCVGTERRSALRNYLQNTVLELMTSDMLQIKYFTTSEWERDICS